MAIFPSILVQVMKMYWWRSLPTNLCGPRLIELMGTTYINIRYAMRVYYCSTGNRAVRVTGTAPNPFTSTIYYNNTSQGGMDVRTYVRTYVPGSTYCGSTRMYTHTMAWDVG